jgi:peptidoglycan/LPS O-acetylase OafA/YrhL
MRIKHIDILRGIAAVMVTVFHLTGSTGLSKDSIAFGKNGYVGVEIFFVISGFVLPYSLLKSGYHFKNFFTFIAKRVVRIYPAYIAAIIISILLTALAGREVIKWQGALLHLLFLNTQFGYNDVSAVFWTLRIEFEFYILAGLLFTYVFTSSYKSVIFIIIIVGLSWFDVNPSFISWLPFFALGILIFNKQFTGMNLYVFWIASAILMLITFKTHGLPEALAGCFAFLFMLFVKLEDSQKPIYRFFLWLGLISYSLYLVHWDVGRTTVAIFRHIPVVGSSEIFRVTAGAGSSIICAYILYWLIEKPSIKLANKIRYKPLI